MTILGLGKSSLPFHMFDLSRDVAEARRAEKLQNIYHRGQDLIWDGREVLAQLLARHGGVHLDPPYRDALGYVLGILMWGELAAWKIAGQLSDQLTALEPKLAATSQTHDEARHFYVLHDYLQHLGYSPAPLDWAGRALLDTALSVQDPCLKIMGMQLLIESMALTLFQALRERRVEPVLADLLLYFEKDEARHVGLGLQFLPDELRRMSRARAIKLLGFEVELLLASIAELKSMQPHLDLLGINTRQVFLLGTAKVALAIEALWHEQGGPRSVDRHPYIARFLSATGELAFPSPRSGPRLRQAVQSARAALSVLRHGAATRVPASSIDPEGHHQRASGIWS